jgi:DNA-damage-inducible protein J
VPEFTRITLRLVAKERTLPFEIKVPNARTDTAMAEARAGMKSRRTDLEDL